MVDNGRRIHGSNAPARKTVEHVVIRGRARGGASVGLSAEESSDRQPGLVRRGQGMRRKLRSPASARLFRPSIILAPLGKELVDEADHSRSRILVRAMCVILLPPIDRTCIPMAGQGKRSGADCGAGDARKPMKRAPPPRRRRRLDRRLRRLAG